MIEASIVLYVIGATIFFIVAMFEAPETVWFTPIWPLVYLKMCWRYLSKI